MTDAIDEYDRMAEAFSLRTGLHCPGKDYPPDMADDGATEDHRADAWSVFKDYWREARECERVKADRAALVEALTKAAEHLDWCGYGDRYERECADEAKLPQLIEAALKLATH